MVMVIEMRQMVPIGDALQACSMQHAACSIASQQGQRGALLNTAYYGVIVHDPRMGFKAKNDVPLHQP